MDRAASLFSPSSLTAGLGAGSGLSDLGRGLSLSSPLGTSHSTSSSSYKSESYSSSTSSTNGGIPKRETHHDSTYKSTRIGDSGIPHTSYSHTSSNYSSDRPAGNSFSAFSYNI